MILLRSCQVLNPPLVLTQVPGRLRIGEPAKPLPPGWRNAPRRFLIYAFAGVVSWLVGAYPNGGATIGRGPSPPALVVHRAARQAREAAAEAKPLRFIARHKPPLSRENRRRWRRSREPRARRAAGCGNKPCGQRCRHWY